MGKLVEVLWAWGWGRCVWGLLCGPEDSEGDSGLAGHTQSFSHPLGAGGSGPVLVRVLGTGSQAPSWFPLLGFSTCLEDEWVGRGHREEGASWRAVAYCGLKEECGCVKPYAMALIYLGSILAPHGLGTFGGE